MSDRISGTLFEARLKSDDGIEVTLEYGPVDEMSNWCINDKKKKLNGKTPISKKSNHVVWNLPFEFTHMNNVAAFKIFVFSEKILFAELKLLPPLNKTMYAGWYPLTAETTPGTNENKGEIKLNINWEGVTKVELRYNVIQKIITWLETRGLNTQGIFRISGSQHEVQELVQACIHSNKELKLPDSECSSVHVVATALKSYLRASPSLFPENLHFELLNFNSESVTDCISKIQKCIPLIPQSNRRILTILFVLLNAIAEYSEINKMDAKNLSIMLSPALFGDTITDIDIITKQQMVVQVMISKFNLFFFGEKLWARVTKRDQESQSIINQEWQKYLFAYSFSKPTRKKITCYDLENLEMEIEIPELSMDITKLSVDDMDIIDIEGDTKFPFSVSRHILAVENDKERVHVINTIKNWVKLQNKINSLILEKYDDGKLEYMEKIPISMRNKIHMTEILVTEEDKEDIEESKKKRIPKRKSQLNITAIMGKNRKIDKETEQKEEREKYLQVSECDPEDKEKKRSRRRSLSVNSNKEPLFKLLQNTNTKKRSKRIGRPNFTTEFTQSDHKNFQGSDGDLKENAEIKHEISPEEWHAAQDQISSLTVTLDNVLQQMKEMRQTMKIMETKIVSLEFQLNEKSQQQIPNNDSTKTLTGNMPKDTQVKKVGETESDSDSDVGIGRTSRRSRHKESSPCNVKILQMENNLDTQKS